VSAHDEKVSVIIPAYNAAGFLPEAVSHALTQTHPPQEVIVIDDGSTDSTPMVCAGLTGIRYVRQENRGEAGARNAALAIATGDFIALLDADDVCAPQRLERQVAALRSQPDAIACFSGHWVFSGKEETGRYSGIPGNAERSALDFAASLLVHPITMMFRRRAAEGLFFPIGVKTGGDMLFTGLLRRRGPFVIIPDVLYGYRRHPQQITAQHTVLDSLEQRLKWLRGNAAEVWPELSLEAAERAMWEALARALGLHYWTRRKEDFLALRQTLHTSWPRHLPRPPELSLRWYPAWVWKVKAWLDSQTH
jgi:glycosyltransferase involved in cell wall biosynthesis